MDGYESKDTLSNVRKDQNVVPLVEEKCEYKLARDARVAKLPYVLKLLEDTSAKLWVFDLCQCLLQSTCEDVKLGFGRLF
jgi:hypothetical protein